MTITLHCPAVNHTALGRDSPVRHQFGDKGLLEPELSAGRHLDAGRRLVQPAAVVLLVTRVQIPAAARDQDRSDAVLAGQPTAGFRDLRGLQ